jgi:hypothetical protein
VIRFFSVLRVVVACEVALIACAHVPSPPAPAVDACEVGCRRRQACGCLDVDLEACAAVCRRASRAGLYRPDCAAAASSCSELVTCERVRCPDASR